MDLVGLVRVWSFGVVGDWDGGCWEGERGECQFHQCDAPAYESVKLISKILPLPKPTPFLLIQISKSLLNIFHRAVDIKRRDIRLIGTTRYTSNPRNITQSLELFSREDLLHYV